MYLSITHAHLLAQNLLQVCEFIAFIIQTHLNIIIRLKYNHFETSNMLKKYQCTYISSEYINYKNI